MKICPPPFVHALVRRITRPYTTASADAVNDSMSNGPWTVAAMSSASSIKRGYYGIAPPPSLRTSQAATRQRVSGSICTPQAFPHSVSKKPGP